MIITIIIFKFYFYFFYCFLPGELFYIVSSHEVLSRLTVLSQKLSCKAGGKYTYGAHLCFLSNELESLIRLHFDHTAVLMQFPATLPFQ